MSFYAIPRHVYVCRTDDGAIILDSKRNRYFGLDHESANCLDTLVAGWPPGNPAQPTQRLRPEVLDAAIDQMKQRKLLTTYSSPRISHKPSLRRAMSSCLREIMDDSRPISMMTRVRFAASCVTIRYLLSCRTLDAVFRRIESRKAAARPGGTFDVNAAKHLLEAHTRMRCYVYAARDHCLYDSLVLVEFFSCFNLFPDFVIGVTTGPFAAHCWVQHEELVFNEDYDRVRQFTPILAK